MVDMSPEDLEKLRRLEEEVDRERDALKKKREEIEAKKAVVVVEAITSAAGTSAAGTFAAGAAETKLPAKKDEPATALVTEADANAWKRGLQKKIAVGAGGVMLAYWLMSNIITIAAIGAVVGGAYYFSGRYLNPPDESASKKKKEPDAD